MPDTFADTVADTLYVAVEVIAGFMECPARRVLMGISEAGAFASGTSEGEACSEGEATIARQCGAMIFFKGMVTLRPWTCRAERYANAGESS